MSDPTAPEVFGASALDAALTESINDGAAEAPEFPDASEAEQVGEQADDLGDGEEVFEQHDVDAPAEDAHKFVWQINGQDVELTEAEVRDGWLRQQDYTRKTQELAQQREQVKQAQIIYEALQANPAEVLEVLRAELLGDSDSDNTPPNPLEQRLAEHEAFIAEQRQNAELQAEIAQVKAKFGADLNVDELMLYAVDNEIPSLEHAFLIREGQNKRAQEERARVAAKRTAPVAGGSRAATQTVAPPLGPNPSLQDAFEAAVQEANRS